MPFNPKSPPKDLKSKIKGKYPNASAKDIRQFIHIFNQEIKDSGDEGKAYSLAWGALKKNKKLKSKKAEILYDIIRLSCALESKEEYNASAQLLDSILVD
jgi:hypothetical protein